ncbi:MAG: DUF2178 domain-containing protein [Gemmatimonadetes bacterium]|nr:DUF2178 domain-containing protein [Gemmatimonadota bacterium]
MGRRDPIFWAATGIFLLALALGIAVHEGFLLLLVGAYLLRPTVHSLGFARRRIDERQLLIQYQASNVAFAVFVIGIGAVIAVLMREGNHAWEMLVGVLMLSLAARALATLLLVGDHAVIGGRIIVAVGLLVALVGALEGGLANRIAQALPGLLVAGLGLLSRKWPKGVGGVVLTLVAVLISWGVGRALLGALPHWGEVLGLVLVAAPLTTAAPRLLRPARDADEGSDTTSGG